MKYIYYIDGKKFTTHNGYIPWSKFSSPDENTPAWENLSTGFKLWCRRVRILHRLTGPAKIFPDGKKEFWLDEKHYQTIKEWINNHPNPDLYFHNIGVFTETDKVLWFLQN
jgi:hypothetical protein